MIKLVRGNSEKLEGRVISFSRFEDLKNENSNLERPIFGIYASINLDAFLEKIGADNRMRREFEEKEKKIKEEIRKKDSRLKVFSFYAAPIPIRSEAELYSGNEDLLDAGIYFSLENCCEATKMGIDLYNIRLQEQIIKEKITSKKITLENPPLDYENYTSVKKELKEYITTHFIIPYLESKMHRDSLRAKHIEASLLEFSQGAPFIGDIHEILKLIKLEQKPDLNLISDYINKIEAIHNEDYEAAAHYRDKILSRNKKK